MNFEIGLMLPDYPPLFWVSAIFCMILIGVTKAGFGSGVGLIATPLMSLFIPVADAAALLLPLLMTADFISIRHYWGVFDRRSLLILFLPSLIGIAIGGWFFHSLSGNDALLRTSIGVLGLIFVLFQVSRAIIFGALEGYRFPTVVGLLIGGISGFTSTLVHAGGPPASVYLLPLKLPRQIFVGTILNLFFFMNYIKLIPYYSLGLLNVGNLTTILLLAPLAFVGVWIGLALNRRFNEKWFNRVIYTMLFLVSIQLVVGQSLLKLLWS
ncbi:MAG: sulfite exporter TauE/SafE family protein [Chloroflexota bacterium]